MSTLLKFVRWVLQKFAAGVLIVVLAVAACGLWLYLKDNINFDEWRKDTLRAITGERTKIRSALDDVRERIERTGAEVAADKDRVRQADKVIADLKDQQSTWDRLVGNAEQQKQLESRLGSVTALRKSLTDGIERKEVEITRATWERDGLEIALGKLDVQLRQVEAKRSRIAHYLGQTLNYRVRLLGLSLSIKTWLALMLSLYFFGPTVGKTLMYFGVAPVIARGRPVRLVESLAALPTIGESRAATELVVAPGERLWIRERFLQASDEGFGRKSRFMLDWRIPLTCAATGLVEMIELANRSNPQRRDLRATLSSSNNPSTELAVVTIPDGASLVLRPSFLAGVVVSDGARLQIRRRWQLFRFQAWVTLQFRFFEFVGPCRLILAGSRGVRVENLSDRDGSAVPARRTNQDATIGFTPNVDYRPARAETFWSYYRGMNPLFDDLFTGRGMFLCQQVSSEGDAKAARKFWSSVWSGVMKLFGL